MSEATVEGVGRGIEGLRVSPLPEGRGPLPLRVEPARAGEDARSLAARISATPGWAGEKLREHGALLFRGFRLDGPGGLEEVARAIDPELKNQYLGTSPRDALTEYVFSASELPPYYPIPQHCEMSFTKAPPRRIFFACLRAPEGPGGETPIVDFRAVLRDLHPEVRERFTRLGVRNVRNYDGPETGKSLDLWKLKRWDEMFRTTDRAEVERVARENGFEAVWKPRGRLALINTQPAVRVHPETGEPVWFNHSQVFHLSTVTAEYLRIATRQHPRRRYLGLAAVSHLMTAAKRRLLADEDQAMHCTFGDGSPIPDSDMDAVREAIWRNLVFFRWQQGDMIAIDNAAIAHGRMPFEGPRQVVVAWS
jgi:alpha-ketoglutarate-dependent taurine dioxygenase